MQAKPVAVWCAALLAAATALAGDLPDPRMTPGATNPEVTQETIQQTVCVRGWTKTVRPPAYYTNRLKKQQIAEYGYGDTNPKHYEEDHLIPLSMGGAPRDPRNLWPQPRLSQWNAGEKDKLEFALYKALCRGQISLEEGQRAFAGNWIESFARYGHFLRRYGRGQAD